MKQLTKAEEEVMQLLWQLNRANVASIIEELPEPKPAYNTVSTIVRILEDKGFVERDKSLAVHFFSAAIMTGASHSRSRCQSVEV